MLNENARISVRISVEESNSSTVTNSIGQGSFGATLASSLNIGCAVEDAYKGDPSTSLGFMDLDSLILQDDSSKMNDKLEDASTGCEKLDNTIKRKQLSVNYDKSKFLYG